MDVLSTPLRCVMLLLLIYSSARVSANFYDDINVTWGAANVTIFNDGQDLALPLYHDSGNFFSRF